MAFIPQQLVEMVLNLATDYKLHAVDEFAILDTLQHAIEKIAESRVGKNNPPLMNEELEIFVMCVISITEKYNKGRKGDIEKRHLRPFFNDLMLKKKYFSRVLTEFEAFKMMNYEVKEPEIFNEIYYIFDHYIVKRSAVKDSIFEVSTDVLRLIYCWRNMIYQQ
jgi:hypothetical protein